MNEFLDLLPQTVTVEAASTANAYGERTYRDPIEYRARVEGKVRTVRAFDGEERVSTVTVYLACSTGIGPQDRITLPETFVPRSPKLLAVEKVSDERGLHHEVVLC